MINKIKDIPDGTGVWVKMYRNKHQYDSNRCIRFVVDHGWQPLYLNDENEILTEEQMRERFSGNDNIPKQGDEIEVRTYSTEKEWEIKKVSHTALITTDGKPYALGQWRYPPKKVEMTLEEIEERLGLDAWSLIIK